uniref:Cullin family profile domain-containing protein n=1 Tax=viral metagenome TaxID=1070528 RepID=A0A6C0C8Z5_9ZZZZ
METFDLKINNSAMDVITYLTDDPHSFLRNIFQDILYQRPLNANYNYSDAQESSDDIIKLLTQTVKQKTGMIQKTINYEKISLSFYVQIWKQYCAFMNELTIFVRDRHIDLIELSSYAYTQIFVDDIILFVIRPNNKTFIDCLFESVSAFIKTSTFEQEYFVENFFDFLMSLIFFKDDPRLDLNKMIYDLTTLPQILEILCCQIHTYLMEIRNDAAILDNPKYYMMQPYDIKNRNISTATMILDLLCAHVFNKDIDQRNRFAVIYTNYLQLRITTPKYDNLDLEIMLAEKIWNRKNLAIVDIQNSLNTKYSYNADVKLNPLLLKKDNWIVDDVKLAINYPVKIKYHLDQISSHFPKDNINWQPTLGVFKFKTILGIRDVTITCNFLQAIALAYFDEQIEKIFTVQDFAAYTRINIALAFKIFESLYESYIIICNDESSLQYILNDQYNGVEKLDIRPIFVKVFEK